MFSIGGGGFTVGAIFPIVVRNPKCVATISTGSGAARPIPDEPAPTLCGSCGATKNEHGELPCGH
jgi:hypothetical protein